jgi:diguanylate cyclase (GGDEF)-like protein
MLYAALPADVLDPTPILHVPPVALPGPLEAQLPRARVLLVDDDEDVAVLVHALLADDGIDVEWAADHDAAIEAVRDDRYAALVIDYHLGSTDGVRLMHELQIRGYDAPMLLLTGSDDPLVDAAAMRAGAASFLSKDELSGPGLRRAIRYARERHVDLARARLAANSMRHEASTDPLTRLGNRRAFDLDLARLVDGDATGGLVIIDLDDLKGINDTLGHVTGDLALRAIGDRIRETIRAGDAAYRIGGDEFAILVRTPGIDVFGRRLATVLSRVAGPDCAFGASIGWAERAPDDTPAALVDRADQIMYVEKVRRREHRAQSQEWPNTLDRA